MNLLSSSLKASMLDHSDGCYTYLHAKLVKCMVYINVMTWPSSLVMRPRRDLADIRLAPTVLSVHADTSVDHIRTQSHQIFDSPRQKLRVDHCPLNPAHTSVRCEVRKIEPVVIILGC